VAILQNRMKGKCNASGETGKRLGREMGKGKLPLKAKKETKSSVGIKFSAKPGKNLHCSGERKKKCSVLEKKVRRRPNDHSSKEITEKKRRYEGVAASEG